MFNLTIQFFLHNFWNFAFRNAKQIRQTRAPSTQAIKYKNYLSIATMKDMKARQARGHATTWRRQESNLSDSLVLPIP